MQYILDKYSLYDQYTCFVSPPVFELITQNALRKFYKLFTSRTVSWKLSPDRKNKRMEAKEANIFMLSSSSVLWNVFENRWERTYQASQFVFFTVY
jgi:hypothetical protein